MIITLTGHRPQKLGDEYNGVGPYSDWMRFVLRGLLEQHEPSKVISGMALGADMIWAEVALNLNIPVIAAVPFRGQETIWPKKSKDRYFGILKQCEQTIMVSQGIYAAFKMQKRNEWMVKNCSFVVAIWDGSEGGTANCVKYAESKNKEVIIFNPKDAEELP